MIDRVAETGSRGNRYRSRMISFAASHYSISHSHAADRPNVLRGHVIEGLDNL
jgi:hypothetical protein